MNVTEKPQSSLVERLIKEEFKRQYWKLERGNAAGFRLEKFARNVSESLLEALRKQVELRMKILSEDRRNYKHTTADILGQWINEDAFFLKLLDEASAGDKK
jgi:hypothetical protein